MIHSFNTYYFYIFAVLNTNPHKFNITIRTEEYDTESESNGLACQLVFTYTEKYPDTAPLVEIEDPINFEDGYEEKLLEHIQETVSFHKMIVKVRIFKFKSNFFELFRLMKAWVLR